MLNLNLPSFQLCVKEGKAKMQVDILCDENNFCSVNLSRMDWYEANLKERLKELCICSQ